MAAFDPEALSGSPRARFGAAIAVALVLHAAAFVALGYSISFRLQIEEVREAEIVLLAPVAPPPPDVRELGPVDAVVAVPRFRPRMPAQLSSTRQRRYGDPALAIWKYLCNRDGRLSEATRSVCPELEMGEVGIGLFDPLNRTGDIGALLGPDTATMSLEEAGAARGWLKAPPAKGQSGLAARTDKSDTGPAADRLGPLPWEVGPNKGTTYNWQKGRQEVAPDLR